MTTWRDRLKQALAEFAVDPVKPKEDVVIEAGPETRETGPMYELDGRRVQGMPTTIRDEPDSGSLWCSRCGHWTNPAGHPLTPEEWENHPDAPDYAAHASGGGR
jgi:hypothetical protein